MENLILSGQMVDHCGPHQRIQTTMIPAISNESFLASLGWTGSTLSFGKINTGASRRNGCAAAGRTGRRIWTSDALDVDFVVSGREGSKAKPAN